MVVGTLAAGPVLEVAHLRGIPTVIHEQNVLPGVTNRIGDGFDAVAVSFEEAVKYFWKEGAGSLLPGTQSEKKS